VLFVGVLWIRWSLMRVRIDQALRLNWIVLLPVALVNVFLAAYWASRS
jgi:NADH-quinone oxidoreductase subunit H